MRLLSCVLCLFLITTSGTELSGQHLMTEENSRLSEEVACTPISEAESTTLLIYPEGLGLVKASYPVFLRKGINKLAFGGIPEKFLPNSLLVRTPGRHPLSLTTMNFRCDTLTFQKLLEKSLGEPIFVRSSHLDFSKKEEGILLGFEKKKVLVRKQGVLEWIPSQDIAFQKIPLGLSLRPTLHLQAISTRKQSPQLEITYLTKGLSWKTNYTIEIDPLKNHANMTGWVTLKNTSGAHFPKASIQLASAGHLSKTDSTALKPPHLYPLLTPTSLYHDSTKKVALFVANQIPAKKEFRIILPTDVSKNYAGTTTSLNTQIWFSIQNTEKNHLGFSIPSGKIKIYATPKQTRYVGTIHVKHIGVGKAIQVPVDTCNLIDASMQQIDFKKMGASTTEATFRVTLTNKNLNNVTVLLLQPLSPDSTLLHTTIDPLKTTDNTVYWSLNVPKNQSLSLRYRVKTVHRNDVDTQT